MPSPADDQAFAPLEGVRVLSLALNLPGPAALLRCRRMGATCLKLEPPGGDPMGLYNRPAYAALHEGIEIRTLDLKTEAGQQQLHAELASTDVLLTSFRPSALAKLKLDWATLQARHPSLSQVAIVGAPGERAEEPGHDLTYLAEAASSPAPNCRPRSTPTWAAPCSPARRCSRPCCCARERRAACTWKWH